MIAAEAADSGAAANERFPKSWRLRRRADFRATYDARRVVKNRFFVVYYRENTCGHPRLGLSVSRRHGNAVTRNRLKRLLREAFRRSKGFLPCAVDLIVIPRQGTAALRSQRVERALRELMARVAQNQRVKEMDQ